MHAIIVRSFLPKILSWRLGEMSSLQGRIDWKVFNRNYVCLVSDIESHFIMFNCT